MSEFQELFGEWAVHADGTPYQVTITPRTGAGGWGDVTGDPVTRTDIPVQFGNRLIRAANGDQVMSSVVLYVEGTSPAASACETGAQVTVDGSRTTTVLRVDTVDQGGLFDYRAVFCE